MHTKVEVQHKMQVVAEQQLHIDREAGEEAFHEEFFRLDGEMVKLQQGFSVQLENSFDECWRKEILEIKREVRQQQQDWQMKQQAWWKQQQALEQEQGRELELAQDLEEEWKCQQIQAKSISEYQGKRNLEEELEHTQKQHKQQWIQRWSQQQFRDWNGNSYNNSKTKGIVRKCSTGLIERMLVQGIKSFRICNAVLRGRRCRFGEECRYAHSKQEREAWNQQRNKRQQQMLLQMRVHSVGVIRQGGGKRKRAEGEFKLILNDLIS